MNTRVWYQTCSAILPTSYSHKDGCAPGLFYWCINPMCTPTSSFLWLYENWFHLNQQECSVIDGDWSGVEQKTHTCPHPGALHTKGRSSPISDNCSARKKEENFLNVRVNPKALADKLFTHPCTYTLKGDTLYMPPGAEVHKKTVSIISD